MLVYRVLPITVAITDTGIELSPDGLPLTVTCRKLIEGGTLRSISVVDAKIYDETPGGGIRKATVLDIHPDVTEALYTAGVLSSDAVVDNEMLSEYRVVYPGMSLDIETEPRDYTFTYEYTDEGTLVSYQDESVACINCTWLVPGVTTEREVCLEVLFSSSSLKHVSGSSYVGLLWNAMAQYMSLRVPVYRYPQLPTMVVSFGECWSTMQVYDIQMNRVTAGGVPHPTHGYTVPHVLLDVLGHPDYQYDYTPPYLTTSLCEPMCFGLTKECYYFGILGLTVNDKLMTTCVVRMDLHGFMKEAIESGRLALDRGMTIPIHHMCRTVMFEPMENVECLEWEPDMDIKSALWWSMWIHWLETQGKVRCVSNATQHQNHEVYLEGDTGSVTLYVDDFTPIALPHATHGFDVPTIVMNLLS